MFLDHTQRRSTVGRRRSVKGSKKKRKYERKIRENSELTLRLLMSYIYIYIYEAPILDVSRSHTTTQHSR